MTLPAELLEQVQARAPRGNVSAWIAQAVAERLGREGLAAALAGFEAEHGPITDEDITAARQRTAWQPRRSGRRAPPAA